jgi:di/tricarboxylate transporter
MELPALPEAHAIAVLALVIVALYLFTRESIPLESSSLAVLVALTVGFELVPFSRDGTTLHAIDFFSGFGHEALIAVCALMIAGHGLVRTGALEPVGRALARLWSFSPALSLLLTLVAGAVLSAFVNNVPIVVLLLPILVGISLHTGKSASAVLMPMGFATLVGGMSTTIGTSTNLLVVSVAADLGMRRLEMFDFFVPAAIAGAIGIVYLWLIAPRMLPVREAALADTSPRIFTAHLNVEPDGFADGRTVTEIRDKAGSHFRIRGIDRGAGVSLTPLPDTVIRVGDRIAVRDTPDRLKEYEEVLGARLYSTDKPVDDEHPLTAEDQQVAEIVITQGSPLENTTLALARFREQFRLVTLALHRAGAQVKIERTRIRDIPLRLGDVLLVQGSREHVAAVKRGGDLLVLDATSDLPHTDRARRALLIMIAIVGVAAVGILPIAISAVLGVLAMILTRCLSWQDAAQALSTPVILIVVASLALGSALLKTGGADYLAQLFVSLAGDLSPAALLSSLMLLMAVLTNIVSNNAAAVIGTPIAIGIAQQLSLPAEPFVLAVLFGANMSYATPMAYKTNLLVMNAGGYTFADFVRVGVPLTLIVWATLSWLLPRMYGL